MTAAPPRSPTGSEADRDDSRSTGSNDPWRSARQVLFRSYLATLRVFMRSLQLRTVALTVLLTVVAIFGVGTYVSQHIAMGLVEAKREAVLVETARFAGEIGSLSSSEGGQTLQEDLETQLRAQRERSAAVDIVSIDLVPLDGGGEVRPRPASDAEVVDGYEAADLDSRLRDQVAAQADVQYYRSVAIDMRTGTVPGIVVAQQVETTSGGRFGLYVFSDLTTEQNTLSFVQRSLLVAAIVLVVLVGAVAWLISRLVVAPIRTGAQVAREIADGNLDQRMPVHGRDEIAGLAQSFNDMATTLQDQITRMEQITTLQRQFVSDVSHELRTPLTTINVASDMIYESREDLDEVARRSAELLKSQVERFENLLGDLLEISRHDAGATELATKPGDLGEIVTGVLDNISVVAEEMGARIVLHAPSSPVMAEVDRVRITRIVRNLVVNAIEHGEGRPIDVYLSADAEAAAVSVRDHGVGMDEEQVEHVFDRFWRADPSRRRTLGGSGLGLAISLEDAHLHGGWLQAWGRPGEGACFRLTLPRRQGRTLTSSPLPLPPTDAMIRGKALVAGPSTSDGTVRIQTGSIPIVVEAEVLDAEGSDFRGAEGSEDGEDGDR
ncbi:MtrAB system histidine kinase MtrB [Brevibacterium litoralis]|uniref:MtrAB system histidine kinase MtrB n=1 Tax=Brevibacterium litoralis TaxID=3138935 RepID=UPI0032EBE6DB